MFTDYYEFINENIKKPEDYGITKYKWVNGLLDCYEDVDFDNFTNYRISKSPFKYGKIEGDFSFSGHILTSMVGFPVKVTGNFSCHDNSLKNLINSPTEVGGYYMCSSNKITSLKGVPKIINGRFRCSDNKLTSLEDGPQKVNGDYNVSDNLLVTLKGSPEIVNGAFLCGGNDLTSLEYCPKEIEDRFDCRDNSKDFDIESFPINIRIGGGFMTEDEKFLMIHEVVKNNLDLFEPILTLDPFIRNKVVFHQMIMRLEPDLIKYYKTIPVPTKKTILKI